MLLLAAVVAMAAAVWTTGRIQAGADHSSNLEIQAGESMLIAMLDQETGLRGYIITRSADFLEPYKRGRRSFETAVAVARAQAGDARDRTLIERQVAIARRWQALAGPEVARISRRRATTISQAHARKATMDRFRAANAAFVADKQSDRGNDQRSARTIAVVTIAVLGLLFVVLGWLGIERPVRRDARRRRRLAEFGDALQVARSEREAFDVLKRHLEGWIDRARAAVLVRNASANRLQAVTGLDNTPLLAQRLEGAAPESCLAVRLVKPYKRTSQERSLVRCEICGELPETSTCVPTVVGGEVVGSVLVQTPRLPSQDETEDLQISIASAGPVIANLRNLALAELRASTDALTSLANHRAVQDTLTRMTAQAARTTTQLTAILFDLDHFKRVNDVYGHAKGDEVLASVGQAVAAAVRESDFIGRYGGEEFVALLPDTTRDGGCLVAEKLRQVVEAVEVEKLDRRVSASFGVAVLPDDATDGEELLRVADRALYMAKSNGRNRVETVRSGEPGREPAERR